MAELAPDSIDVTHLQFKLQAKKKLFEGNLDSAGVNLVAAASNYGLVFCGTLNAELEVIQLASLEGGKASREEVPIRVFPLPGKPVQIAVSCDSSWLAVALTKNGTPFLQIYDVPSFCSAKINLLCEFPIDDSNASYATSLLWNPVQKNLLAVVTKTGRLFVFTISPPGFEACKFADASETVQSACWSPKGKQLVAGFPNGKLVQFKPDLKPARTILCPSGTVGSQFGVISLQWLSTYQFAAVFQSTDEDTTPALYIINAPKTGNPTYINYDDVCYGQAGPRAAQVFLIYVLQWNLLIVGSANSTDIALLAHPASDTSECPVWRQYTPPDNARAELPLNDAKDDTFPLGLALETGSTHRLTIGETQFPVMPMLHILSTDGILISFTLLNTEPNTPDICSPPAPIHDTSGLSFFSASQRPAPEPQKPAPQPQMPAFAVAAPAPVPEQPKASPFAGFGGASQQVKFGSSPFGGLETSKTPLFGGLGAPASQPSSLFGAQTPVQPAPVTLLAKPEPQKPTALFSVGPSFTTPEPQSTANVEPAPSRAQEEVSEETRLIAMMTREEIKNFSHDLAELKKRTKTIQIGNREGQSEMAKSIVALDRIITEATEINTSLSADTHSLRLGLNEGFAMAAEARKKTTIFKKQNHLELNDSLSMSQTSKRQLQKLKNMISAIDLQLQVVMRQLDAQWCEHQDALKSRKKATMRIPSLENIYQTVTKQRDIIATQQVRLAEIKKVFGHRLQHSESFTKSDTVDSLTDSLLSMSVLDQVRTDTELLTSEKVTNLRDLLKRRPVSQLKPNRPNRVGLNSEIVREKREQAKKLLLKSLPKPVVVPEVRPEKPVAVKQVEKVAPSPVTMAPQKIETPKPFSFNQSSEPKTGFSSILTTPPSAKPVPVPAVAPNSASSGFGFGSLSSLQTSSPVASVNSPVSSSTVGFKAPGDTSSIFKGLSTSVASSTPQSVAQPKPVPATQGAFSSPSFASPVSSSTPGFGGFGSSSAAPLSFGASAAPLSFGSAATTSILGMGAAPTTPLSFGSAPKPAPSSAFGSQAVSSGFGTPPASSAPSTFSLGSTASPVTAPTKPVFVLPGGTSASPAASSAPTAPVFKASVITSTPTSVAPKAVQAPAATSPPASTTPSSIFGTAAATFGTAPTNPFKGFSTPSSEAPTPVTTSASLFGSTPTSTPPASTGFGGFGSTTAFGSTPDTKQETPLALTKTPSSTSPFGAVSSTPASTAPDGLFSSFSLGAGSGTPSNANSNSFSLFGASTNFATPPKPNTSIFGSGASTAQTSAFGSPNLAVSSSATTPVASSPFGAVSGNANTPVSSPFGAVSVASTAPVSSPFGATSVASTAPASSPFGVASTAPVSSPFGAASTTPATQVSSPFGSAPVASTTQVSSPFGAVSSTATTQVSSPFGATTTPASSPFGAQAASPFGAQDKTQTSPFASVAKPASPTNIFGQAAQSPGVFGQSSNSIFGQASAFGQTPAPPAGGSIFGGGSAAPAADAGFGSNSGFGSAGFSSGGGFSAFSKPTFGGAATFGGGPVFGGPPKFGAPGFGSTSPGSIFGSSNANQPPAGAQAPPAGQPTNLFEQLGASNSSLSFGNLAQTGTPPQQNTSSFGGSAFTSWR